MSGFSCGNAVNGLISLSHTFFKNLLKHEKRRFLTSLPFLILRSHLDKKNYFEAVMLKEKKISRKGTFFCIKAFRKNATKHIPSYSRFFIARTQKRIIFRR
jgi:hypothetical protein